MQGVEHESISAVAPPLYSSRAGRDARGLGGTQARGGVALRVARPAGDGQSGVVGAIEDVFVGGSLGAAPGGTQSVPDGAPVQDPLPGTFFEQGGIPADRPGFVRGRGEGQSPWPPAVAAIRLLMLTGCRSKEISTLRWDDVDRSAGELRLRETKTGSRMVPLTPTALAGTGRH